MHNINFCNSYKILVVFINYFSGFILGLVFFLFGMNVIETGLNKISGRKLSTALERAGGNPLKGLLLGAGITGILQSSSAVTVMLAGAVDAEIVKLKTAIGIIMGANIGTSVTAWIISASRTDIRVLNDFNIHSLYPVLGLAGIIIIILSKNNNLYGAGMVLVGFTLIMSGMSSMREAAEPLKESGLIIRLLTETDNPLPGIISGAITTAVLQSSSATIGILQAFSCAGRITAASAIPIILGQNIGTCATAVISTVGSGKNSKRTAAAHLIFNISGVIIWTAAYNIAGSFFIFERSINSTQIALIHTLFNLTSALILLPFTNKIEKATKLIIK